HRVCASRDIGSGGKGIEEFEDHRIERLLAHRPERGGSLRESLEIARIDVPQNRRREFGPERGEDDRGLLDRARGGRGSGGSRIEHGSAGHCAYPLTIAPASGVQPSAMTKNASFKGSETIAGGTIIIPIDISTAAMARSITRNGRKIRKPTSKPRWISLRRKEGTRIESGISPSASGARGAAFAIIPRVSGSTRVCMKLRNGSRTGPTACSGSSTPSSIGWMPASQAAVKTGSMTK